MGIKTKHIDIIDYWRRRVDECDMGIDWADAVIDITVEAKSLKLRCWRCSDVHRQGAIERCHIKAAQFGGEDKPSNYILLCRRCHEESPDLKSNKEAIWEWIKATSKPFYGTFLSYEIAEEFKKIYNRGLCSGDSPIMKELSSSKTHKRKVKQFIKKLKALLDEEAGSHAFARRRISPATFAMLLKKAGG
jgi:hypothetical protein